MWVLYTRRDVWICGVSVCMSVFPILHVLPYIEILVSICMRATVHVFHSDLLSRLLSRALSRSRSIRSFSFIHNWVLVCLCVCQYVFAQMWTSHGRSIERWASIDKPFSASMENVLYWYRDTTFVTDWTHFFFRFRAVRKMFVFSTFWLWFYVCLAFFTFEFHDRLICKFCGQYWRTKYRSMDRLNGSKYGNCILIQILWIYVLINSFIQSFVHVFALRHFISMSWGKNTISECNISTYISVTRKHFCAEQYCSSAETSVLLT